MQNSISQNNNIISNLSNVLEFPKIKKHVKKEMFVRVDQMTPKEIIAMLQDAMQLDRQVQLQMNKSFYSEDVANYSGYLFQNEDGRLFLRQEYSTTLVEIIPTMIRSVEFLANAA